MTSTDDPSVLGRLVHRLAAGLALAGGGVACAAGLLTTVSVIGRAGWAAPIQGDVELVQFGIAVAIALCLPWCQYRRGNIIVDFFTTGSRPSTRRRLDQTGALLLATMMALLAWRCAAGAVAAMQSGETTIIRGLPMWPVYAVLSPGLGVTALVALYQVFSPADAADPAEDTR